MLKGVIKKVISPFFILCDYTRKDGKMVQVTFRYKDAFTHGKWNEQSCIVESVSQAIEIYGLGIDCEYEIMSVTPA